MIAHAGATLSVRGIQPLKRPGTPSVWNMFHSSLTILPPPERAVPVRADHVLDPRKRVLEVARRRLAVRGLQPRAEELDRADRRGGQYPRRGAGYQRGVGLRHVPLNGRPFVVAQPLVAGE